MQLSGLKLLGGRPCDKRPSPPMSDSSARGNRQMLSSDLLLASISLFTSAIKCGTTNTNDPMPIITAPEIREKFVTTESQFGFAV